jgi:hypothetical protein
MKLFLRSRQTPARRRASRRVIFLLVRVAPSLGGVLAVILLALSSSPAHADAGLEPGVHVDPGSPAAKEYEIPLSQARQTGSERSSANSSSSLFGAGIGPRGGSGSARGSQTPQRASEGRARGAKVSTSRLAAASSATQTSGGGEPPPGRLLAASARASGDSASLLTLLAGGAAVVILAALAGAIVKRNRHWTDTA